MHVIVIPVEKVVLSVKKLSVTEVVGAFPPKDGYWKVVWKRKRKMGEEITGPLIKKEAEIIADALNALSVQQAALLVKSLHLFGRMLLAEHQRKHSTYTGRSFARE